MSLYSLAQGIKYIGLGNAFTWDLFTGSAYETLSLYLGSISHKFSNQTFLLISEYETTTRQAMGSLGFVIQFSQDQKMCCTT